MADRVPYLVVLETDQHSGPSSHDVSRSSKIQLVRSGVSVRVDWSWPSRCYRLRRVPVGFESCREVWLLIDGYPALRGEPGTCDPGAPAATSGCNSVPDQELDTSPEAFADEMTCFTSVLIAPQESIVKVQRDSLGGRTAYWHHDHHSISVSTSPARIFAHRKSSTTENADFMAAFFANRNRVPGHTAFSEISEVRPGEELNYRKGQLTRRHVPAKPTNVVFDQAYPVAQFREVFCSAVKASLPAGERPALMLSGGMDSAPVAAVASTLPGSKAQRPLAISWKLSEFPECDEARWIETVADFLGLDLDLYEASHLMPFSALDTRHVSPDSPVYNAFRPLILEAYRRAQAAGAKVILNASGGDMSYPHPGWQLYDQLARGDIGGSTRQLVKALSRNPDAARIARWQLRYLAKRLIGRNWKSKRKAPEWLSDESIPHFATQEQITPGARRCRHPLYFDNLMTSAHGTARESAFSNRFGLDRRDPFQHPDLVQLMLQVPFSLSNRDGVTKWIMRQAMDGLLPDEVRLKKRTGLLHSFFSAGFNQNKPLIREFLLSGHPGWQTWVRRKYVESALACDQTRTADQLLIANCIGHSLWKQALKAQ